MVSVVVVRPFGHLGRHVDAGEWIDLEPLDAAVKAYEGLVSLSHGRTYQTRDMVASHHVESFQISGALMAPEPASDHVPAVPLKRRRGRPRKAR